MTQRKKTEVREAILAAAFQMFRARGYSDTTIPALAKAAGISTANVYVYFGSKTELLMALYEPWLHERLDRLDRSIARCKTPRRRMDRMLIGLWRDLPREDNGFTNNLVPALSTAPSAGYSPALRKAVQARVAGWIGASTGWSAPDSQRMAGVVLMAFDGFAINRHLAHGLVCSDTTARLFARLLSG